MSRPPGPSRAVSAVVVSYNARDHLEVCLKSLISEGVASIVVVDNGSSDGSRRVAEAAGVRWRDSGGNVGYGRAANLGAADEAVAGAEFLLVCNPDLEVLPGCVTALMGTLAEDDSVGLVGPRLSNPDGSLYPSARTFPDLLDAMGHGLFGLVAPGNPFTRRYRLLDWDHSEQAMVDWVSGACFLVRRTAWDSVGGFDPSYFMYMEDVDLCWRLGRAGWRIAYQPGAEVIHAQGVSADQHPYRMLAAHHQSMWRFAWRTSSGGRRAALPVVGIGLVARFAVAVLRRRLAGPSRPPAGTGAGRPLP